MTDSDEPQPAGFKTPAVYVNRFAIRFFGPMARIVFSDAIVDKHGAERVHVAMSAADAKEIGEKLLELAGKHGV